MPGIISSPDWGTIGANIAVFSIAVATLIASVYKAIKNMDGDTKGGERAKLAGGILMDNMTMVMLSQDISENTRETVELRHAMIALSAEIRAANMIASRGRHDG